MQIRVEGSGFETTPANNLGTFNLGGVGVCTAATPTSLVFNMTTKPTQGDLELVLTNVNGVTPPVQVATIVPTQLVGHWPLNEGSGTVANDLINGNDFDISNLSWDVSTPGTQAGSGGCLAITGDDQGTAGAQSGELPSGNASRTYAYWFYLPNAANAGVEFRHGFGELADFMRLALNTRYFSTGDVDVDGTIPPVSSWHHAALTWDGWTLNHYLDGVLIDSNSVITINTSVVGPGAAAMFIRLTGSVGIVPVRVKDLRIYDSALPASEILALFTG